jgi:hypothetical protein
MVRLHGPNTIRLYSISHNQCLRQRLVNPQTKLSGIDESQSFSELHVERAELDSWLRPISFLCY